MIKNYIVYILSRYIWPSEWSVTRDLNFQLGLLILDLKCNLINNRMIKLENYLIFKILRISIQKSKSCLITHD